MTRPDFTFGVATAAFQIEGAVAEDGRGPSIWDTLSHTPGRIERDDNADVACDHYHRVAEDVALMADLGIDAYRFSIAWPRIFPEGDGDPNPAGLAFYSDLVDRLIANGITPYPTLYHWDLPQPLEDRGGWRRRQTADDFARYAATCVEHLGDRVTHWATLNEPWCSAILGHWAGIHAPGHHDIDEAFVATHHLLLGHGRALTAMRNLRPHHSYGIALNANPYRPADGVDPDSIADAKQLLDDAGTGLYYDPVLTGSYPNSMIETSSALAEAVRPGDLVEIGQPLDWLGVNYYFEIGLRPSEEKGFTYPFVDGVSAVSPDAPTDMGWGVTPTGLTAFLLDIRDRVGPLPPIYITENGAAYDDPIVDGRIADQLRIDYLRSHLAAVVAATDAGVEVAGYFVWSLLDNFEWSFGYRMRFGLVHVDFDTLKRTPRDSYFWYRDHIAAAKGREAGPGESS